MDEENHYELAMGDHGRSGVGQWDIWNAVFGPQGADGYPAPAWDKETGTIDHSVTDQWRAYDLNQHLQANWATLAPQLQGRLHIYVGDDDTSYLNDAVELLEQWLVTADPPADAEIQYGHNQPHCWSPYTSQELVQVMADFMASHPD
jgi:hypothetical protein